MIDDSMDRTVLAQTLYPNSSNPLIGMVFPVAEIVDDKVIPISRDNFCKTQKVFITSHYDELEKRFPDHTLFKLKVTPNLKKSDNIDSTQACEYIATANMADEAKARDFFQVINAPLPNPNGRLIQTVGMPSTKYIFIDDETNVYGPFRWKPGQDSNSLVLDFIDAPLPGVNLANAQIYQIDSKIAAAKIVDVEDSPIRIMGGLEVVRTGAFYDYASDAEVVKYCLKLQSDIGARIIEKSKVDSLVLTLQKVPGNAKPFIKQRLGKLSSIIGTIVDVQSELQDSMLAAFATESGREVMSKFIEQNEARFLDRLKREKESEIQSSLMALNTEQQRAQQRLSELDAEKRQASDQLQEIKENIRKEIQANQKEKIETAMAETNISFQKLKSEMGDVERQLAAKKSEYSNFKTLSEVSKQIEKLRSVEEFTKEEIKVLKDSKRLLQSEAEKSSEHLRARLIELKPLVDAINGSYFPETISEKNVNVQTFTLPQSENFVNKQREVVRAIATMLAKHGRVMQDWEIANLLVTTQQSFITVLAGLPGTGKTTLARLLAQVQGLTPRLHEVPVARGWTSQKDLIGYFNPLTSRFQPSNTGVYDYLSALEAETEQERAMSYLLLDEANLSPIEHYWSSFMDMADGKEDRTLRLGQQEIKIPSAMRFIGTINYDGTTEPLSQRLINRAPIIVIDESEITHAESLTTSESLEIAFPLPATQMDELFGKSDELPVFDPREEAAFQRIKKTLVNLDMNNGRPVSISPRKEIAILHYCNKARALMGEDNELTALDLAVCQHILPLVNGNGTRFKSRLELLKTDLDELVLPRSAKYLERMIAYGSQDLHSYDFFCW
ncbi:hypothetical protein GTP44_19650 [Duganella sp. FT50W]|uniref:AAA domain-containing protein n=1 Tax=Duganella lactea TaxID=2692173 RepID=A0A6L8MPN7_9BURK|nr:hypothetical protein [Duganella lactea]MYM84156.1 hypothetical protein [Duganella lactea]